MARETGLEPATSGVTGRTNRNDIKAAPKIAIKKSRAISIGALGGFGTECVGLTRPMHASTGINRYMHEFQNRPTAGSSDCPGCAGRPPTKGRTQRASQGRLRTGSGPPMAVGRPLGMESRWWPSVLILGSAALEAGEALHDGRDDGRRWRHSARGP
jgi:hypothetical protein